LIKPKIQKRKVW